MWHRLRNFIWTLKIALPKVAVGMDVCAAYH